MELKKGTSLLGGKYRIEGTLGQGSFGITYLATTRVSIDGQLGKMDVSVNVTIKEFFMSDLNSRTSDGTCIERTNSTLVKNYLKKFQKEAENLSKLHHPNIVKVLDVFDENNTTYYVMEFIDGETIDEYIKKKGRLSVDESLAITREVCNALQYMHDHKMLHLDLKPKNIMRDKEGHIYLIDFGLAKQYTDNGEPESSTTLGLGTPGYAPIEQAHYKQDGTFPVTLDIYAVGASLYKMLTGKTPPESSYILNDGLPLDALRDNNIADDVIAIVEKAMAPIKKNRYQTVAALLDDITTLLHPAKEEKEERTQYENIEEVVDNVDNVEDVDDVDDETIIDQDVVNKAKAPQVNEKREAPTKPETGEGSFLRKYWKYGLAAIVILLGVIGFARYRASSTPEQATSPTVKASTSAEDKVVYPTFTDMAELQVGDFVYSDGSFSHEGPTSDKTCIGMVFSLKTTTTEKKNGWTHGQMVALEDAGDCAWSDDEVDFPSPHKNVVTQLWGEGMIDEIKSDKDGYVYSTSKYTAKCPAFKAVRNYKVSIPFASSGWYMPSIGQWCDILENICGLHLNRHPDDYIEVMLSGENNSYLKFDTSAFEYWSSSDRSKYYVWVYQPSGFECGGLTNGRKGMGGKVRAVAAF